MSDSPPPYSPPPPGRLTPLPSIWTRVFNWVHDLGVAVADEDKKLGVALDDLESDVTVAVEDLRPRVKHVQITLAAVDDIRFCENLFDKWVAELDKTMSGSSKKPDEREELLRFYLGLLKEDAKKCSKATNAILQCHIQFASLMAQRIDDASESYNLKYDNSETTRLASDISDTADLLSTNASRMKDNLNSFVSELEEVQVTVKKERSLGEQIMGWLKSLFEAITRILATLCPPISTILLHSADSKVKMSACAVSTLGKAAATFCTPDPELQEGNESESLDSVILFLKKIVLREAQNAQNKLERFDEALDIMGLERHMREGRRVTLYGPDPAAVAEKWRGVAKKYQSMLSDDEDPTS